MKSERQIIGVIPAGGSASRIAPLPCSKEIYPVGFHTMEESKGMRPKVACHYLLEKMKSAGVQKVFVVLRQGKWDIPTYFGDGHDTGMHMAYLIMRLPYGTPFTVDQAYPFVHDHMVVFGFPDIIIEQNDIFVRLLERQNATNAEVVLALFPARTPQKMDMVDVEENGRIRSITIKPLKTDLHYTWIAAVWTPVFSGFMHEYLRDYVTAGQSRQIEHSELYVGNVIEAAINNGLAVESVRFSDKNYRDIGTPEDLLKATQSHGWVEGELI